MERKTARPRKVKHRVRLWHDDQVLADVVTTPDLADRYADSWSRRFDGLEVTNETLRSEDSGERVL
jgi:hypothetical protein